MFTQKNKRNPEVTFPQQGERTVTGDKLPRADRHKNLRSVYVTIGDTSKPWRSKLKRVL